MVAVTGTFDGFSAVKPGILPVPDAAKPIEGVLLVQLYTVPATAPVKLTGAVGVLAHTVWLAGWLTVGVGFTVMVKVTGKLTQVTPPLV